MRRISSILLITIFLLCVSGCKGPNYLQKKYGVCKYDYYNYLDTISSITIEYKKNDITEKEVTTLLVSINDILLNYEKEYSIEQTIFMNQNDISESTLMRVNENSGITPIKVSSEFITLLEKAIDISKITYNKFNPAIGALSSLWNISKQSEYCDINNTCKIPSQNEIEHAKTLIDVDNIIIDKINQTVFLKEENMKLDLGGIVKGDAADCIMDYLVKDCFTYIAVNLGGNIKTYGKSFLANIYTQEATIVPISIENPDFNIYDRNTIMDVHCENMSIVTSGINKRYIEVWDEFTGTYKKYHHLLDPQTGYPATSNIKSVSIIGPSSLICDGLSTGVYILGIEEGIQILNNTNYSGIIVTNDLKIYIIGDVDYTLESNVDKVYQIINI